MSARCKKIAISRNYYTYRITKFNPKKRNEQGAYLDSSEWIAISDIGRPEYNSPTYEEYEQVENAYVAAVRLVLKEKSVALLKVDSLELRGAKENFEHYKLEGRLQNLQIDLDEDIVGLHNHLLLNNKQIEKVMRLILREVIWMVLSSKKVKVEFGYDYYMYVESGRLSSDTIRQIEKSGLFVEQLG